eukprot:1725100-Rhodomonas_salina.2
MLSAAPPTIASPFKLTQSCAVQGGATAILVAAEGGFAKTVALLISRKANVNLATNKVSILSEMAVCRQQATPEPKEETATSWEAETQTQTQTQPQTQTQTQTHGQSQSASKRESRDRGRRGIVVTDNQGRKAERAALCRGSVAELVPD